MAYISFQPNDYFNTKLYTGNGSTQSISSVGFQPDWVWLKGRSGSGRDHLLFDAIRGATNYIKSNADSAEATISSTLTSFDSDGFSIGSNGGVNANSETYASWNWLAGGSGSANSDGSITSTVSANTTSGFSIVKYTGTGANATVGHGIGSAPSVIIQKNLNSGRTWLVKHPSIGTDGYIRLDATNASATDSAIWNSTNPTSTVFSIGTNATINGSGATSVAYCFAPVKGYSAMGSYTGNGSTDGTFVYTGFKPAMVILKRSSTAGNNWNIVDNKRNTFNVINNVLNPSSADAEVQANVVDFTSNGFKLRISSSGWNHSGDTFIFMAFAESPLVSSNGVPATAR